MNKLFVLLFLSCNLYGQCKFEKDEFTGDITIKSKFKNIGADKEDIWTIGILPIEIQYYKFNAFHNLVFYPKFCCCLTTRPKDPIYLKFENDTIIKLFQTETTIANYILNSGWYDMFTCTVSKDVIDYLRDHKLIKIGIHQHTYNLNKNGQKFIPDMISCVENSKPSKK